MPYGESFENPCICPPAPGTVAPGLAPFVVSLNSLHGIITIAPLGGISITSSGNTIFVATDGTAGLGTVTSVEATSSNSNLTVTGGPVTVAGTFTFDLAGNLDSISGLVMAADQMIYSTAADTFAATSLTSFARTILDDAAAVNVRSTLGLVIGTNVQAWGADLDSFVTNASYAGANLTLDGSLTIGTTGFVTSDFGIGGDLTVTGSTTVDSITANSVSGDGSGLTNLDAGDISAGTLAVARGGTNIASYAVGDLIIASGATTLAKLPDVAAGAYLRSGGVTTAPLWSTLILPNAATVGDIFSSATTNNMSRITAVATGNALISGGVATLPTWGKITTSHTTGIAASGANSDITSFSNDIDFNSAGIFNSTVLFLGGDFNDVTASPGNPGDVFTSNGTGGGAQWSNQIALDTLTLDTNLGLEGTITAGGVTGNQTINKPSGTIRIAAAGTSVVVTNSLATTSHRCQATVCSNDTTAKAAAAVVTSGAITIYLNAAATAETEIAWLLHELT